MATKGTYTAYSQLRPLQGDVSQDIQQQEENGFKRREEKRYEDKVAQDRKDKDAAKKQLLWDKYVKPLSANDTGSKSLNEIQGKLLLQAQKEYVPLMAVINNPKSSDEDRLKATLKLYNINKLPENMLAMTKSLTQRDLAIKKAVAEGKLFANPEYDKNYQEGFSNKMLALDENGMPMIAFNNPDGSTDLETYDHIQNAIPKYDFSARFDRDQELLEASTKLQPEVNQTDDGVKRIETTAIDPVLLKNYVSNQLFEADGVTPSSKLKSFAKESGVALTDKEGLQKLANGFENDIRLRVKGGTKVTRNYNALDVLKEANDERARRRAEAKDNEGKPNEELGSENINKVGVVTGGQKIKDTAVENADGAQVYSVQGSNLERSIGAKGAYERVKNIYVLKDGKTVVFDIDKVDGTVTGEDGEVKTSNTTKVSYRSDKNANEIADFVTKKKNPKTGKYYKNVAEFNRDALGIDQNTQGNKKVNTATKTTTEKVNSHVDKNGRLVPERTMGNVSKTNKGEIGLSDESWYDVKTRKKIEDNQVINANDIASRAKESGYTTKEYQDLLEKKGIYIIQN